ncbi:MAG: hypothetical protein CME01_06010 [Geminicoccus sp.]|jgi:hypothetical protein|nr:hypothetical protein [Geminicoccus sp.]
MNRAALALLMLLGLAACGFQPQLRDTSGQYDISIPALDGRDGQILRAALVQRVNRFNQPITPTYVLDLALAVEAREVVRFEQEGCAASGQNCTWLEIVAQSPVTIRANSLSHGNLMVWQGVARGRADVRLAQLGWAGAPTLEQAKERALIQLADDIAMQVGLALSRL